MKKKNPEEKVVDLLNDKLPPEEIGKVISGLKEAGIEREEIESMKRINHLVGESTMEEPSSNMDRRFYELLANEKDGAQAKEKNILKWRIPAFTAGLRIAAGIALFLLGWFMADWSGHRSGNAGELAILSSEVKDLKTTLILSMMHQTSTLERIKAVNMVNEFENADDKIIESLLRALNNDNNDNVRLLSLEALIKYSDNPAVREGLVASIPKQSSPMIQLRLTEVMVALNEKKAASEFQKVLLDAGLNFSVRNKINEAITVLL